MGAVGMTLYLAQMPSSKKNPPDDQDLPDDRVFTFAFVPPNLIDALWADVAPLLGLVIGRLSDVFTMESEKKRLMDGTRDLLVVMENNKIIAVLTFNVATFDSGLTVLEVPIIAGKNMARWGDDAVQLLFGVARSAQCSELRGYGIKTAWKRIFKHYNVERVCTIFKMPVPGGD